MGGRRDSDNNQLQPSAVESSDKKGPGLSVITQTGSETDRSLASPIYIRGASDYPGLMRCAKCAYDSADVEYRSDFGLFLCNVCLRENEAGRRFRLGLPYAENPEVRRLLRRIFGDDRYYQSD